MFFLRKIPSFRSGKRWKSLIASGFYLFAFLAILAVLFPSALSLALDKIDSPNKSSVSISGETYAAKPVYLLQNDEVIKVIKADSKGKFYFALNNLI